MVCLHLSQDRCTLGVIGGRADVEDQEVSVRVASRWVCVTKIELAMGVVQFVVRGNAYGGQSGGVSIVCAAASEVFSSGRMIRRMKSVSSVS